MTMMKREDDMEVASLISPFADQIPVSSFAGIFDPAVADGGFGSDRSSFGFLEMLGVPDLSQFFLDQLPPASLLEPTELPVPIAGAPPQDSSEAANLPATPNSSSISSSSTEAADDADPGKAPPAVDLSRSDGGEQGKCRKVADAEDAAAAAAAKGGGKKKVQKREREPCFAFRTKSEVDHLEDGYRWRKYGQKAVKNSPFPRSYYRCTTAACGVKKRLERSSEDPAVVVTTYEGKHTHPSPALTRAGGGGLRATVAAAELLPGLSFAFGSAHAKDLELPYLTYYLPPPFPLNLHHVLPSLPTASANDGRHCNQPAAAAGLLSATDCGLLQDLIPSEVVKKED